MLALLIMIITKLITLTNRVGRRHTHFLSISFLVSGPLNFYLFICKFVFVFIYLFGILMEIISQQVFC